MDSADRYHRHCCPIEVVSRCIWLYFRYSLSYRAVEEMMFERGVTVSWETISAWCRKFGGEYANCLKKCHGPVGDIGHLDEVYLRIDGQNQYLWWAVDQEGEVIDILVQSHRDARAEERCFKKFLNAEGALRRPVVTDRLGGYCAAMRKRMPGVKHIESKGANTRAENTRQATRHRERRRYRFSSAGSAQRLLCKFSFIINHFRNYRHTMSTSNHRLVMAKRFTEWHQICGSVS